MEIRKTRQEDLQEILGIYERARTFMREHGNAGQWGENYPPEEMIRCDIEKGDSYVCEEDGRVQGVFYYAVQDDPTYREIDGAWLTDGPYGVVHRIASAGGARGIGKFCLDWAFQQCGNLRIDTHDDNLPMQNLLKKLGFQYCGRIRLEDGSPRIAFQKISLTESEKYLKSRRNI